MNGTVLESHPSSRRVVRRRVWLCAGGLLWGLVAVASVLLWRAERADRLAAEQHQRAALQEAVSDRTTGDYKLTRFQTGDDGSIKLNISDLIAERQTADEASAWSPEGIDDFSFTNCDGRTITKADLLGRPWAVCFVFTQCLGPCPTVTRQMKLLQDRLKNYDIRLVTITVDSTRDTPEVLLKYAKQNGADLNRWYFLGGDQREIYGLIHNSFRMPVQEITGPGRQEGFEVLHSTNVLLVDAHGMVRNKFNAAKDEEMVSLRREFQQLAERLPTSGEQDISPPVADAGR